MTFHDANRWITHLISKLPNSALAVISAAFKMQLEVSQSEQTFVQKKQ